jgi:hypothetical protein
MDELEQLRKDVLVLALRLLGEDRTTMSCEVIDVMDRWQSKCYDALRSAANGGK